MRYSPGLPFQPLLFNRAWQPPAPRVIRPWEPLPPLSVDKAAPPMASGTLLDLYYPLQTARGTVGRIIGEMLLDPTLREVIRECLQNLGKLGELNRPQTPKLSSFLVTRTGYRAGSPFSSPMDSCRSVCPASLSTG